MTEFPFQKVAGWLKTRLRHKCFFLNFVGFFRIPILCNICEWLFLVLAKIGLVLRAANLSMFFIIVCKSVFEVLVCSFQLILHWWTPNQRTNVDNTMQLIMEVYFDIQTSASGDTRTLSVWITSFTRCIRAWQRKNCSKSCSESVVFSVYIIRKQWSCSLFILLFKSRLWNIQKRGEPVVFSVYIIRKRWSYSLFILLFKSRLWNIQKRGQ